MFFFLSDKIRDVVLIEMDLRVRVFADIFILECRFLLLLDKSKAVIALETICDEKSRRIKEPQTYLRLFCAYFWNMKQINVDKGRLFPPPLLNRPKKESCCVSLQMSCISLLKT